MHRIQSLNLEPVRQPLLSAFLKSSIVWLLLLTLFSGCAGTDSGRKSLSDEEWNALGLGVEFKRDKEGRLFQEFDVNRDGIADVRRFFSESVDPKNPELKKNQLVEKWIDINNDGKFDVKRFYNNKGILIREAVDTNFDGFFDTISHFDDKKLARRDFINMGFSVPSEVRYYEDELLARIEKDDNNDGKVDHWEYYERGELQRIGYDFNADGRVDRWQRRVVDGASVPRRSSGPDEFVEELDDDIDEKLDEKSNQDAEKPKDATKSSSDQGSAKSEKTS